MSVVASILKTSPVAWLMKSEPDVYSIDDLQRDREEFWEGVRNYQARNFMRDHMKPGDFAFFYHSRVKPPAIAGLMKITKVAIPDDTALDPQNEYYDPKHLEHQPRWFGVNVLFLKKFETPLTLPYLREDHILKDMLLLQKGSRLSVQPVLINHFYHICQSAQITPKDIEGWTS